jgi:D-inositol-3-phosphate glycosyltransferase
MISFIWPPGVAMLAGTGGSETFTAGHVRELLRRGRAAQVVSVGHGKKDGRNDFKDIPFLSLDSADEISKISGTVVFVNRAYDVPTKNKSAIILHCATSKTAKNNVMKAEVANKTIIATSIYNAQQWAVYLDIPYSRINIVLPFADPVFGNAQRSKPAKKSRIVFAGRLHPDKGIYTLLEMMHEKEMQNNGFVMSLVTAGQHVETGQTIAHMLKDYPYAKLVTPQKSVTAMAQILGQNDILLVPSVYAEPFGMLSVEAQHTGCRVIASNIGGLPETNCGLLTLVEPRDPRALIAGIEQAVALGAATKKERAIAKEYFALDASVDALLVALKI